MDLRYRKSIQWQHLLNQKMRRKNRRLCNFSGIMLFLDNAKELLQLLMLLNTRNILFYPVQILVYWWVSRIIFTVLHHVAGNPVHSPWPVPILAHEWPARVPSTRVWIMQTSVSHTDGFLLVLTAWFFYDRHAWLLKEVCWSSRMFDTSPS